MKNRKRNRFTHAGVSIAWPAPTTRRERIAAGVYHRPVAPTLTPTVKSLPKKLAKILRRMADGDTLRPLGLSRFVQDVLKLLCKVKSHLIDRLVELGMIELTSDTSGRFWRLTALGRAAIGLRPIDTGPLARAAAAQAKG